MEKRVIIGQLIKKHRKLKGLTQKELANKLNKRLATICDWENGTYYPKPSNLESIFQVLDIPKEFMRPDPPTVLWQKYPDKKPPHGRLLLIEFCNRPYTEDLLFQVAIFLPDPTVPENAVFISQYKLGTTDMSQRIEACNVKNWCEISLP